MNRRLAVVTKHKDPSGGSPKDNRECLVRAVEDPGLFFEATPSRERAKKSV